MGALEEEGAVQSGWAGPGGLIESEEGAGSMGPGVEGGMNNTV